MTEHAGFVSWLEGIRACAPGVRWARERASILEAGEACPDSEWLLWTVSEAGFADATVGRGFSLACLKKLESLLPDQRQRQSIALLDSLRSGCGTERDRAQAEQLATQARSELAASPRWSMAAAAAGAALWHATGPDAWAATFDVRRDTLRAIGWDPWSPMDKKAADHALAKDLKDLLRPHAERILEGVRARFGQEPRQPARPCGGC